MPSFPRYALGLALGLCLGSALPAQGEEGGEAFSPITPLPPVLVPLPVEVEAPSAPARRDPSGALSLIEVEEYQGEAKETAELLAGAPGLIVQDSGGVGQAKSLSLRGAASSGVLVLLDGVPLNAGGGSVDLGRLPAAIIQRLEVLRGGGRYGSGGLGGVVNVVTRKAEGASRVFAEVTQGSAHTSLGQAGATGEVAGGQGLLLVHAAQSQGDFLYRFDPLPTLEGNLLERRTRENNQALRAGALLKLRRSLPASLIADATAEFSTESRGLAGTAVNPTPDARQGSHRAALGVRLSRTFASADLEAQLYVRQEGLTLEGGGYPAPFPQQELSAGMEVTGSMLLGVHSLSLLVGAAGESLREPTGLDPSWARLSLMAGDELLLLGGSFILAPSLRFDLTGPFQGLSPKLGAVLLLPWGVEVRSNVGQAHRAPSFLELYVQQGFLLPNEGLRPERALYADVAVGHRTARSMVQVGAFASLYEDLISYEYYPPMLSRPYNFATAQVTGIEAEGEARPFPWLSAAASYTLLATQNLRDDPRYYLKPLPYRPRHKLSARLVGGPSWARARAELLYQSEQFLNRTGQLSSPGRAFLNVGLSSQLTSSPRFTASVEVKNLLDAQSEDLTGYPLPGRSGFLTLALAWDLHPQPLTERVSP